MARNTRLRGAVAHWRTIFRPYLAWSRPWWSLSSAIPILQATGKMETETWLSFTNPLSMIQNCSGSPGSSYITSFSRPQSKRSVSQHCTLRMVCPGIRKGEFPTRGDCNYDDMSQMRTRTHQSLSLESCGRLVTKFSGMLPYVDVCFAGDILDLVDPRLELSDSEYKTGLICRG